MSTPALPEDVREAMIRAVTADIWRGAAQMRAAHATQQERVASYVDAAIGAILEACRVDEEYALHGPADEIYGERGQWLASCGRDGLDEFRGHHPGARVFRRVVVTTDAEEVPTTPSQDDGERPAGSGAVVGTGEGVGTGSAGRATGGPVGSGRPYAVGDGPVCDLRRHAGDSAQILRHTREWYGPPANDVRDEEKP